MKNTVIILLVILLVFTAIRLADVERQLYALITGMCLRNAENLSMFDCLSKVQPRSSNWWNLFYGLTN